MGPGGRGLRPGDVSDGSDDEMEDGLGDFLSDESEDVGDDDEEEEGSEEDEEDGSVADDGEEWGGIDSGESDDESEESGGAADLPAETTAAATTAPTRYVPPHMRAAQLAEKAAGDSVKAAERVKLERKAQGLLNK